MAEQPQDLNLPTATVNKIIKDCLPVSCKVSKEANTAITRAASVFIMFATFSAHSVAQRNKRKTITGTDVVTAMGDMQFDKIESILASNRDIWKKDVENNKVVEVIKNSNNNEVRPHIIIPHEESS